MESDDDSRSSNSSASSNSSSNAPTSPQENDNSNDQPEQPIGIQREGSLSQDSNSFQEKHEDSNHEENKTPSPANEQSNEQSKDGEYDEEELELSDMDDEDESNKRDKKDLSHEDLSDISDLESSNDAPTPAYTDLRQKLEKHRQNGSANEVEANKNDEDELDFEDEMEVKEPLESTNNQIKKQPPQESKDSGNGSAKEDGEHKSDKELESGEELEDGEVTDGDEKRPEESEPKAVCRFFTRGQCTWGMSCRFLHPGTTDKGNYTMFDLVRPIPVPQGSMGVMPSYDYRTERPPIHHPHIPPHPYAAPGPPRPQQPAGDNESAWERGLRTAKEMMRKANKRKEQDMDFDEKKMNLSGPPDEIERDPYYARTSPDQEAPPFEKVRAPRGGPPFSPPAKYQRAAFYEEDQYGRMARSYRELPPHRMPHYEDEEIGKRRPNRPTREVIVEKASDDWNDPWMRKSPGRGGGGGGGGGGSTKGRKGRERSYSSNSSYSSSSSSSRSHSSSDSSPSPTSQRRRFEAKPARERITPRKVERKSRSASLKRRHSPVRARVAKKASSPAAKRIKKQQSPSARVPHQRKKRDNSSSSSGESDSSYSSSTSSSKGKKRREKNASERKPAAKKVEMTKKRTPPPATTKEDENNGKEKGSLEKASAAAKLKSSRREELLKQLKAVEDAIARKRSKIT